MYFQHGSGSCGCPYCRHGRFVPAKFEYEGGPNSFVDHSTCSAGVGTGGSFRKDFAKPGILKRRGQVQSWRLG